MKYLGSILLFVTFFLGCKTHSKNNPEAIKLNSRAMHLAMDSSMSKNNKWVETVIGMLNEAIKIDSNYFVAYSNKFMWQNVLKQYDQALLTGERMLQLRPNDPTIKMQVAVVYEKTGDNVTAMRCYNQSLSMYNKLLDTMNTNNSRYKELEFEKASDLVLLHQEQKGYAIMKGLYDKESDSNIKQMYRQFMNYSRADYFSGNGDTAATKIMKSDKMKN